MLDLCTSWLNCWHASTRGLSPGRRLQFRHSSTLCGAPRYSVTYFCDRGQPTHISNLRLWLTWIHRRVNLFSLTEQITNFETSLQKLFHMPEMNKIMFECNLMGGGNWQTGETSVSTSSLVTHLAKDKTLHPISTRSCLHTVLSYCILHLIPLLVQGTNRYYHQYLYILDDGPSTLPNITKSEMFLSDDYYSNGTQSMEEPSRLLIDCWTVPYYFLWHSNESW